MSPQSKFNFRRGALFYLLFLWDVCDAFFFIPILSIQIIKQAGFAGCAQTLPDETSTIQQNRLNVEQMMGDF